MRLLVIEDYRPLQQSLQRDCAAVDTTGDGQAGLWSAMGTEYDVIILDLMLPGMDGLSILNKLRANGRQSHVLILTAKDTLQDRIKGLDLHCSQHLYSSSLL